MSEPVRTISTNDMHVIWTQFLSAADAIQTAMCRFDEDHVAQSFLNDAMQAALTGAEQCRQLHASKKERIAIPFSEEDQP